MTSSNSTPSRLAHASPPAPGRWPWLFGPACMVVYPVVVYALNDRSDARGLHLTIAVLLAGAVLLVTAVLMSRHETDRHRRHRQDVHRQLLQQVNSNTTALQQMSSWRQYIDTELARLTGYLAGTEAAASTTGELARHMGRADECLAAIAGHLEQLTHPQSPLPLGDTDASGQALGDEPDREVLVYVGHRVHSLVSRMLEQLKATEREHEDPDLLDDLYRIDHLAVLLRRAAGRLAVLGGHTARQAHSPVPLSTVLRQAVVEVEDFSRIQLILPDDDPKIPGHAGPDVIHVVAELLENATKFSHPDTKVSMSTRSTPEGLGVEIRDEGLPLTAKKLQDLRRILTDPHRISPRDQVRQGQIGMLVAARLASRHNLRVELHAEVAGTRALIVLPHTLLTATARRAPEEPAPELPRRRAAVPAAPPTGLPASPPVAALLGAAPHGTSSLNGSGMADDPSGPPLTASSASDKPTMPAPEGRPALPRRSQAAASPPPAPGPAGPPPDPAGPPTPGLMWAFTSGLRSAQDASQQNYTGPDLTGPDRPADPATG